MVWKGWVKKAVATFWNKQLMDCVCDQTSVRYLNLSACKIGTQHHVWTYIPCKLPSADSRKKPMPHVSCVMPRQRHVHISSWNAPPWNRPGNLYYTGLWHFFTRPDIASPGFVLSRAYSRWHTVLPGAQFQKAMLHLYALHSERADVIAAISSHTSKETAHDESRQNLCPGVSDVPWIFCY